ncbi:TetR/AcrR family transcriptional regulator [Jatrophihabitans sp. DSM 45814]
MVEFAVAQLSVRERLDRSLIDYLTALTPADIGDVNIEAVAQAAGVSRATAYRHFGDRDGLLFHAAILLTRRHGELAAELINAEATVAGKVEVGFAYTAREIRADDMLRLLLTSRRTQAIDGVVRSLAMEITGPGLREGQLDGQVRDDLTLDELIDWLTEQQHVVIRLGLDEDGARAWVRHYMLPILRPEHGCAPDQVGVKAALAEIAERAASLNQAVSGFRASLL